MDRAECDDVAASQHARYVRGIAYGSTAIGGFGALQGLFMLSLYLAKATEDSLGHPLPAYSLELMVPERPVDFVLTGLAGMVLLVTGAALLRGSNWARLLLAGLSWVVAPCILIFSLWLFFWAEPVATLAGWSILFWVFAALLRLLGTLFAIALGGGLGYMAWWLWGPRGIAGVRALRRPRRTPAHEGR